MGTGHVTFFYDKGIWLMQRHQSLIAEMQRRDYQTNVPPLDLSHWPDEALNDWEPTENALGVCRQRIQDKLEQKPEFYTYYGETK
jgi:deoxyribonuclease (pyrimidine dimer)